MRILAVDNKIGNLKKLKECLVNVYSGEDEIVGFTDPESAIKYGADNNIDILYTEIDMRNVNGFSLINSLKQYNPNMRSNIVTSNNEYKGEALRRNIGAYILKPISIDEVKKYVQKF